VAQLTTIAKPEKEKSGFIWWFWVLMGFVFMFAGWLTYGQPWTQPEVLQAFGLDLSKTITNIGVLLVWIPLIKVFFWDPLMNAMNERNSELVRAFTESENLRTEMQQMKTDYEKRIQQTEAEAREKIQESIREAQRLRDQMMEEARRNADVLIEEARTASEQDRQRVISELRRQVVDLTLTATSKLVGESINPEKDRQIVEEFLSQKGALN
jgi:F-type H+-transporting ATPase subunit b